MGVLILKPLLRIGKCVAIFADLIGAFLLLLYAVVMGPLGVLRGPLVWERTLWYLSVFAPMQMLVRFARMVIDWRLGHFDLAIAQGEAMLRAVEQTYGTKKADARYHRVLLDLYVLLSRAYLHSGNIDAAMQMVLRANRVLGVEKLPGLSQLDAKTCHLVRAGLAAGRLLEGGGLTTLFVRTQAKAPTSTTEDAKQAASEPKGPVVKGGAKVIPFPSGIKPTQSI
jgi:hypothetical protein